MEQKKVDKVVVGWLTVGGFNSPGYAQSTSLFPTLLRERLGGNRSLLSYTFNLDFQQWTLPAVRLAARVGDARRSILAWIGRTRNES